MQALHSFTIVITTTSISATSGACIFFHGPMLPTNPLSVPGPLPHCANNTSFVLYLIFIHLYSFVITIIFGKNMETADYKTNEQNGRYVFRIPCVQHNLRNWIISPFFFLRRRYNMRYIHARRRVSTLWPFYGKYTKVDKWWQRGFDR